jgi:hypothetical protein
MRHLLRFSVFFAALHIVVSTTTNGHDCTGPCQTSTWGGTTCYINAQSTSSYTGWITCPSNGAGGGGLLSCYDWCGYTYALQCDGSCTAKTGASCGSSSGTCKPTYVCVDANYNTDSHCAGSSPSAGSTATCQATACSSTPSTPTTPPPPVVSVKSKNGFNCLSSGCGSTLDMTGTWCYVPVASSSTCPSGSMSSVTGCYDYCGYKYIKTGSSGTCTSKPGADCGPSSGHKQDVYKCVDKELYNGDQCTGSVPVSYVDCENTACPPKPSGKHCSSSALSFACNSLLPLPDARP